jgi:hypothetical protein
MVRVDYNVFDRIIDVYTHEEDISFFGTSPEGLDWIFLSRSEQLVYNSAKSHPDGGHWP